MKRLLIMFLVLGLTLIFINCSENIPSAPELNQADQINTTLSKKPAAKLVGTMELDFVAGLYEEDELKNVVWDGTINFEGVDVLYGIRFHHLSPSKGFSNASPFEEYFEIYDLGDPTQLYLGGPDVGVTTLANSKYRMNGEIDLANAPFEEWLGRHVHMSGVITWQTLPDGSVKPETAPGILRIN